MSKEINIHLTRQDKEKLYAIAEFIVKNPDKPATINELVKQSGIYRSKLTAAFKRTYRTSIYRYILTARMKYAKMLLLQNDLPVKSIARECGYKTVQSFSKAFKKYYRVTPSRFQRK